MMVAPELVHSESRRGRLLHVLPVVALLLCLAGCGPGGDQGQATAPSAPSPQVERQALANLLALYQEAVVAEDSDRLHALLAPEAPPGQAQTTATPRQDPTGTVVDLTAFQETMRTTFRQSTVTALAIPSDSVVLAPDQSSVTFLEVESTLDPLTLAQQTRVYRTTWQLRRMPTGDTATFGIAAVQRAGPLVQITTPGQVQAGTLTRVSITTSPAGWDLASVGLDTATSQLLPATPRGFHGTFRAAVDAVPAPLQVRLRRTNGEELVIAHPYRLRRAGADEEDLVVQVTAPEVAGVRPVQFSAIIGELDTPAIPRDIAVAGDVAYVADRRAGLLVIDVHDPTQPELLHTMGRKMDRSIVPEARSLALQDTRLYLGAARSARLYVVDISAPRTPNFAVDADGDGVADVVLAVLDFPGITLAQTIEGIAVQGHRVYAISNTFSTDPGTLYVVDVQDPRAPQILSATPLPTADPSGLAVLGDLVYVAAEAAGLLVFDVRDPTAPVLVATLRDPEPDDNIEVALSSGIALAGAFAYVVETRRNQSTNESTESFTVLDLRTLEAPHRRGSVWLTTRPQLPLTKTGLTVTEAFAYVGRGVFGLEALDIRNPDAPRRIGFVDTPSEVLQVTTAGNLLYVIDALFGLQVIQGPGPTEADIDGDGVFDFFDAFPTDPTESEDSDGDRLGDNADPDDDNDGFTDAEEAAATPPTKPKDPLSFPVRVPPPGATPMVVDAATPLTARARQGTSEAPYRTQRAVRVSLVQLDRHERREQLGTGCMGRDRDF